MHWILSILNYSSTQLLNKPLPLFHYYFFLSLIVILISLEYVEISLIFKTHLSPTFSSSYVLTVSSSYWLNSLKVIIITTSTFCSIPS